VTKQKFYKEYINNILMMEKNYSDLANEIKGIIEVLQIFNNAQRLKILDLCHKNPKTITELRKILKSSNKVTWHNVKSLEEIGFLELDKRKKETGQPVYVTSNTRSSEAVGFFGDILKLTEKEQRGELRKLKNKK